MRYPPQPHPSCDGWLMQKVIARETITIPCHCDRLCLHTACRQIQSVHYSGLPVQITAGENGCVRISIPLSVQLCDPCGRLLSVPAQTETDVSLPRSFQCQNRQSCQLVIFPCVRLLCAEESCGCFAVQLQIVLEMFLVCHELCGRCKPACPQLPLYPPPIRPHC